jgi:hypothetical protein
MVQRKRSEKPGEALRVRVVVLSIADGTPRKTHASRFTAKHVLSLAWATRNGVVAETMRRGPA